MRFFFSEWKARERKMPPKYRSLSKTKSRAAATMRHYNFGVEIESIGKPYGGNDSFTNVDWYRMLAERLRNRGIDAVHDDCSKYSKHPEYYGGKWFVTRDGSLKRPPPYVCMEVVSPRLDTTLHNSRILSDFWEAMGVHFNPQRDASCGGHVHVTPFSRNNKFRLGSLKKIAFAAVVYEDFVAAILPPARRTNPYCVFNSHSEDSGLHALLGQWGKSTTSLVEVARQIRELKDATALYRYMQGNRYVLWNFQNIFPNARTGRCTGTVEFRGGNQFLNTSGTLAWVAFVLGFITLALDEKLLRNFKEYIHPSHPQYKQELEQWWTNIQAAAKQSKMKRHLPEKYHKMLSK